ncbi:hypothetical protein OS493_020392, partial [Desmophyllum pertusum]
THWLGLQLRTDDSSRTTGRGMWLSVYLQRVTRDGTRKEIAVFGGGDNAGGYFNDLVIFHPCNWLAKN